MERIPSWPLPLSSRGGARRTQTFPSSLLAGVRNETSRPVGSRFYARLREGEDPAMMRVSESRIRVLVAASWG